MQTVIVQIPMSKELKEKADAASSHLGFSLEKTLLTLLSRFIKKEILITAEPDEEVTYLSKSAERRFKKAVEDIHAGRNIATPKNKEEFFKLLRT